MRLAIRHTTRYRFDRPVKHGLQRLRLFPKGTQGQRVLDWSFDYENAREEFSYEDQNCNRVMLLSVTQDAQDVVITCSGTVMTQDEAGVIGQHSGHMPLWAFLGATDLTRPGPGTRKLVEGLDQNGGRLDLLHGLSARIRDRVRYETGRTGVETTAEQAVSGGCGVCQDHAHIFIAAARFLGIPARYVSGYLMMDDRVDQSATHAWAEGHVPGLGWVGFDVSNGISPDPRYVRLASGRDYREAAPVLGTSLGASAEGLTVNLAVEQQQAEQ
ncbi:transglutaminase family protein [Altericroceibacterium xinjiangense]|uniref:transglutaminase family protein n=1 Tax=Altericroceibacterium xinjiangense TaxID=762261 RepID=UPI000F7EC170|nr:transglutaminase family protein [Altericroceibacterium xinjiangense]